MTAHQPSPWLYAFLRAQERFRPTAYKPTRNDRWTLGFGHTDGVTEGGCCTLNDAETWLVFDCRRDVDAINKAVVVPLTQPQFDALCSLVFNIGVGAFEESTLLRKLNDRQYAAAADEFLRWDHQHGKVMDGLLARRKLERAHYLSVPAVCDAAAGTST